MDRTIAFHRPATGLLAVAACCLALSLLVPDSSAQTESCATATPGSSGGGGSASAPVNQAAGSAPGTPANHVGFIASNLASLSGPAPVTTAASVTTALGGDVVAGNIGLSLPSAALSAAGAGTVNLTVTSRPAGVIVPGGPFQFSPNGTIADVAVADQKGKPVTTFASPVTLYFKYNAADLAMAGGTASRLAAAYLLDAASPAIENPLHFPVGTWVLFPPSVTTNDTSVGILTVLTQALGSVVSVVSNPVGYVETLDANTPEESGFDPATSKVFGEKPQFSYLQVVEPQIGTRLLVLDPATGNYAYVDATDVGPSGPPPSTASGAVVRGLIDDGQPHASGFALNAGCTPTPTSTTAPSATATPASNWTLHSPATSPSARQQPGMAFDAARGDVVLFGGFDGSSTLGDTWTWNGTTWTQQTPATSPPARLRANMAYDAATSTVVLFGGFNGSYLGDTWTWNGTTWTQQTPATSPPGRYLSSMAYDTAAGKVVLFGGSPNGSSTLLADTWTWNGVTWTQQTPATSPSARYVSSLSDDPATGTDVLFGGSTTCCVNTAAGDTWTWNGTTWTQQFPATSPPARYEHSMAYDAVTASVVLFGGLNASATQIGDTWTWNGSTWTQKSPASSPSARDYIGLADDTGRSDVVLFGGSTDGNGGNLGDTWTWAP